jgi:uncharacterized membrane protein YbaN (DUF454 family)
MGLLSFRRRDRVELTPPVQKNGEGSIGAGTCAEAAPTPEIEIDETGGSVRVHDRRVFHAGRRVFCRHLIEAATRRSGVRRAEVDLTSASCRIEFSPGSTTPQDMANAFADAVREAVADAPATEPPPPWRRATAWVVLTAYPLPGDPSLWETLDSRPGQIRLRHRSLAAGHAFPSRLPQAVSGLDGVEGCWVSRWSGRMTIEIRRDGPLPSRLLDGVERALEDLKAAEARGSGGLKGALTPNAGAARVATGMKRPIHLALAAGSFAMTLIGLVVPGIPTVPFLLATSYYLARSSPSLDDKLRRTAFFGPILQEWEQFGGLSRSSKGKLIGLTVVIILVTVAFAPLTPLTLVVILVFSSLSVYGLIRMPGLPEEQRARLGSDRPASLAPSAP